MDALTILNIPIRNIGFDDFVTQLDAGVVFTPNVDHLVRLQRDRAFWDAYQAADHLVCDSRIVQWLSWLLYPRAGIIEQIAGSDLLPACCVAQSPNLARERWFLLGGSPESVSRARDRLDAAAGRKVVAGVYSPPFGFEDAAAEADRIVGMIRDSGATMLAVGVGSPKQELWIYRHRSRLPQIRVFMGVGATIDFLGGAQKRAPRWMTKSGLEWLYRLAQEPARMSRRYLVQDLPFFWLVVKQRLGRYRNPWA
jgi:exopolysaccharide biosynthesis WecB/TagA/CpsF family protein